MKRMHIALGLTLAAAAWLLFFGDTHPDAVTAKADQRTKMAPNATVPRQISASPTQSASRQSGAVKTVAIDPIQPLQARQVLIGGAHDGAPNALFGIHSWTPPPIAVKAQPLPPPSAPQLPFTVLGKQIEDGKWRVFLARGDQTFIAVEQMVIDGMYRVDAIVPPQINFVYLPLQKMQTLSIGGAN